MDRPHLLDGQILERYVAGRLTVEEAAEFEEYMLEHPEVIDQVEAARQLKLGLRTLSQRGALAEVLLPNRRPAVPWLMAAGIAAAILGTVFFAPRPESSRMLAASLQELPATLRERSLAGEYILVRTRGEPVAIILPRTPAPISISLVAPRAAANNNYSVSLACNGKNLSIANDLRASPDGMVVVFLDPSTLESGACEFHAKAGSESQTYPVQLTTAGN